MSLDATNKLITLTMMATNPDLSYIAPVFEEIAASSFVQCFFSLLTLFDF